MLFAFLNPLEQRLVHLSHIKGKVVFCVAYLQFSIPGQLRAWILEFQSLVKRATIITLITTRIFITTDRANSFYVAILPKSVLPSGQRAAAAYQYKGIRVPNGFGKVCG